MKTAIAFTALALLVTPVWAYHQDSNPDLKQSITNVHENHFPLFDIQAGEQHVPHKPGDTHVPEKGNGDTYGSVLNN